MPESDIHIFIEPFHNSPYLFIIHHTDESRYPDVFWIPYPVRKVLGSIFLVIALAVAIIPQFTTCESQGKSISLAYGNTVPMKCNWTAKGEIAVAVPLLMIGGMMTIGRRKESQVYLSVFGVVLGILTILLPTSLIGVCSSNMLCNTVMKPSLMTLGSAAIVSGLVGIMIARRRLE